MKNISISLFDPKKKSFGFVSLLAVLLTVGVLFGLVACMGTKTTNTQPGANAPINTIIAIPADDLYQYINTYVGDNSKVVAIIDLLPVDKPFKRESVYLQTDEDPYEVVVYYKTNDPDDVRENVRQYNNTFLCNAAVMFALIPNMSSLAIDVSDQSEESFYGHFIEFKSLNEHFNTDYFTKEQLESAVTTIEDFNEYVDKVMTLRAMLQQ